MTIVAWVPSRRPELFDDLAVQRMLGLRILALREQRGWTQEDLVEHSGLDRSHIARVEAGRINVSLRTISRLARGLGVGIDALFRAE